MRVLRFVRWALYALVAILLLLAAAHWVMFWGPIEGLTVSDVRSQDDPAAIVVDFSVDEPLNETMARKNAEYTRALLVDCDSGKQVEWTVAIQNDEYFKDDKAVRRLFPDRSGRARYQVHFGDLVELGNRRKGLCFSLTGGSMFGGRLWSDEIPLTIEPNA